MFQSLRNKIIQHESVHGKSLRLRRMFNDLVGGAKKKNKSAAPVTTFNVSAAEFQPGAAAQSAKPAAQSAKPAAQSAKPAEPRAALARSARPTVKQPARRPIILRQATDPDSLWGRLFSFMYLYGSRGKMNSTYTIKGSNKCTFDIPIMIEKTKKDPGIYISYYDYHVLDGGINPAEKNTVCLKKWSFHKPSGRENKIHLKFGNRRLHFRIGFGEGSGKNSVNLVAKTKPVKQGKERKRVDRGDYENYEYTGTPFPLTTTDKRVKRDIEDFLQQAFCLAFAESHEIEIDKRITCKKKKTTKTHDLEKKMAKMKVK